MYKDKITKWFPNHFRGLEYQPYINSMGASLDALEVYFNWLLDQTFLTKCGTEFLNVHAKERSLERVKSPGFEEADETFRRRIRRLKYTQSKENLSENIEAVSQTIGLKDISIVADFPDGPLQGDSLTSNLLSDYPGDEWGNYGPLDMNKRHRAFSVVISSTIREPLAFFDENYFGSAFFDTRDRVFSQTLAQIIKQLIKDKSSAGSGF